MTIAWAKDRYREQKEKVPLFQWDVSEIHSQQVKHLMEIDSFLSEEDAGIVASNDIDLIDFEWEDFVDRVNSWLTEQPHTKFLIEATNVGWRNGSGWKIFEPQDGLEFIQSVVGFPRLSDYTLLFWETDAPHAILEATLYHHDSPMGEMRVIYHLIDFMRDTINKFSIQTLQRFLSAWCETNEYPVDDTLDFTPHSNRRKLTKEDFVSIAMGLDDEEMFGEESDGLHNLYEEIDHYTR